MTDSEILIIGGGIAGCAAALFLAEHGRRVTLLERGAVSSEASGVNAGSIGGLGWGDTPDLEAWLTMGSLELFKQLQLDRGFDVEFRHSGTLQAIHNEAQHAYARAHVEHSRAHGLNIELLSSREARTIEPGWNPALPGAAFAPWRGQADPLKTTRAFAAAAERAGARVLTGQNVEAIQPQADGTWHVTTGAPGDFHAGALVLAAGAWCAPLGAMLGLRIPVVPVRGQMWATPSLPPRVFHTISSFESTLHWAASGDDPDRVRAGTRFGELAEVAPALAGPARPSADTHQAASAGGGATPPNLTHQGERRLTRHLYGRQTRDGRIIFGGDRQDLGYDKTPDPSGIEINHDHASEVLPFLRDVPIERTRAGLMPFTLDGKPLIGRIPQRDNLYIVSGLASGGFGRGPMAGKLLADLLHAGHLPAALAAADPARCVALL